LYNWIIVGAGFSGSVLAERLASQLDHKVLVIDRRDHVAGNAFDYQGDFGILVHKYGPHIFHTNSKKVWDYLSDFTRWRPYFHHVLGMVEGQLVPIPFNLNSIAALFPPYMAESLSRKLITSFGFGKKIPILKLRETDDEELKFIADYVYRFVFETYTRKQWDLRPEDLAPHVTARVPVFISRDDRYFQDVYQAMPAEGYTAMFRRLLVHSNIQVSLNTTFAEISGRYPDARIIFTGPIDEYFAYAHGALPYRSLRFELESFATPFSQPVGTVNYPNEFDFTRITELKRLTGQDADGTVTVREYSQAYVPGVNEPYYPVPTADTAEKLKPYRKMAEELSGRVYFAGRLGDYAYYNMDQAVAGALALFDRIAGAESSR
jgi:UDP-galactopyranose mutase